MADIQKLYHKQLATMLLFFVVSSGEGPQVPFFFSNHEDIQVNVNEILENANASRDGRIHKIGSWEIDEYFNSGMPALSASSAEAFYVMKMYDISSANVSYFIGLSRFLSACLVFNGMSHVSFSSFLFHDVLLSFFLTFCSVNPTWCGPFCNLWCGVT